MPKQTYANLPEDKRRLIHAAALAEFSTRSFGLASVNAICKGSGIPKGSFYQYFENKLDLYRDVMNRALREKNDWLMRSLQASADLPVRERLKSLYAAGFAFAAAHPAHEALGARFAAETDRDATAAVLADAGGPSVQMFLSLVTAAQKQGEIKRELPASRVLRLMFALHSQIAGEVARMRTTGDSGDVEDAALAMLDDLLEMVFEGIGA